MRLKRLDPYDVLYLVFLLVAVILILTGLLMLLDMVASGNPAP